MNILVIGDACVDEHVYGTVSRLCPEAPVPILKPSRTVENPGMAANVQNNFKALGREAELICNSLRIVKRRYVDERSGQMLLRVDENDHCERIANLDAIPFNEYDAVVVSDYNKGFLRTDDIEYILENSKLSFIDTKKDIGNWICSADFIKINKDEYRRNLDKILDWRVGDKVIATLGRHGAIYGDKVYEAPKVELHNVSGAGDTFLAALVHNYLETKSISNAIEFANLCASKVIQKPGVATC